MMKKYGWVIEIKKDSLDYPGFYQDRDDLYSGPLRTAFVYKTKAKAQFWKIPDEVVRKVELFKNGKAKKVIKCRELKK